MSGVAQISNLLHSGFNMSQFPGQKTGPCACLLLPHNMHSQNPLVIPSQAPHPARMKRGDPDSPFRQQRGNRAPQPGGDFRGDADAGRRECGGAGEHQEASGIGDGKHGSEASDERQAQGPSRLTQTSPAYPDSHPILPPRGDYRTLLSFQKAEVVYDLTFRFCHKFLPKGDRTVDQMVQAARSGKKNILEGSKAALTSKETEIKLTNVARASLEELLDDFRDFLRARDKPIWDKESKEALYVRKLGRKTPQTYEQYREFVETRPPEIIANIAICLIHQTNYLLDQQLRRLEQDFLKQGGLRERMTRARLQARQQQQRGGPRP
jgi:four helix bundle suffix protein